jgi:CYTH domain-containing protein
MKSQIEIERKFIIKMPSSGRLEKMPDYGVSEITQTYLTAECGTTERVRRRAYSGGVRYFHTVKRRIDKMSCDECEREIDEDTYNKLLKRSCQDSRPIVKTRHAFSFGGLTVEIDMYRGWEKIAVLEVELPSREAEPNIPDFIEVLFDATGNFAFSNASLAKHFPSESEILKNYL